LLEKNNILEIRALSAYHTAIANFFKGAASFRRSSQSAKAKDQFESLSKWQ
jgi:hypothetical protein